MTASSIPVSGTGKSLQTFANDLGSGEVHSEAVTPTDASGIPFSTTNRLPVKDSLATAEFSADQAGVGAVLSFTFSGTADFVIVDVDSTDPTVYYRARARLDGVAPTATVGFVCRSGQTTYLPFATGATVKVYAPNGTIVSVQVGRY